MAVVKWLECLVATVRGLDSFPVADIKLCCVIGQGDGKQRAVSLLGNSSLLCRLESTLNCRSYISLRESRLTHATSIRRESL